MRPRSAIGIDPDAKGIRCSLVGIGEDKPRMKGFLVTQEGMEGFIRWAKKAGDVIIAVEGSNGQSKPIRRCAHTELLLTLTPFMPTKISLM